LAIKERVVEDEDPVSGRKAVNPLGGRRAEIPQQASLIYLGIFKQIVDGAFMKWHRLFSGRLFLKPPP